MWLYPLECDGLRGVRENLRLLPRHAHQAILQSLESTYKYPAHEFGDGGHSARRDKVEVPTASISTQRGR